MNNERKVVTTQATSKALKLHSALSLLVAFLGMFVAAALPTLGTLMFICGCVWFVIVRIAVWWNHG